MLVTHLPGHFVDSEAFTGRLDHPTKHVHVASALTLEMWFTLFIAFCLATLRIFLPTNMVRTLVLVLNAQTKYQKSTVLSYKVVASVTKR